LLLTWCFMLAADTQSRESGPTLDPVDPDRGRAAHPHRALYQAAPLRPLPDGATNLDHLRVRRHDRVGGVIHEYRLVA
jgi:hypothetical protein